MGFFLPSGQRKLIKGFSLSVVKHQFFLEPGLEGSKNGSKKTSLEASAMVWKGGNGGGGVVKAGGSEDRVR